MFQTLNYTENMNEHTAKTIENLCQMIIILGFFALLFGGCHEWRLDDVVDREHISTQTSTQISTNK